MILLNKPHACKINSHRDDSFFFFAMFNNVTRLVHNSVIESDLSTNVMITFPIRL